MKSHLILGTAQLTRSYGVLGGDERRGDISAGQKTIEHAGELNLLAVDTAPIYDSAEGVIGAAQTSLPVHTKLQSGIPALESLRGSLDRLNRSSVEVVYLHEELTLDHAQLQMLVALNSARGDLFAELGVSIYDESEFDLAIAHPLIDVIQLPYNLFDQRFGPERLGAAVGAGKKVFARSIFLQGLLLTEPRKLPVAVRSLRRKIVQFQETARRWSLTPLQGSLYFAQQNQNLSAIIVGASNEKELHDIHLASCSEEFRGFYDDLQSQQWPAWPDTDPRRWSA